MNKMSITLPYSSDHHISPPWRQNMRQFLLDGRALLKHWKLEVETNGQMLRKMRESQSVFVHVPKTGGKSILTSLYGVDLHDGFGHAPIQFYQSIFPSHSFNTFFKFAFVRNPWDRLYSGYQFAIQGGFGFETDIELQNKILDISGQDFPTFVKHFSSNGMLENSVVFQPQYTFICDRHGHLMVDHVFHFERFRQSYAFIRKQLRYGTNLSQLNRSSRLLDYKRLYDEESQQIVQEIYAKDIELFKYSFDSTPEGICA